MLRTFLAGAVVAFLGSRVIKMNKAGKFDGAKQRLRDRAGKLRGRLAEQQDMLISPRRPAPAPVASRRARRSPDDNVSRPARPHPWPVDPRALPPDY